MNSNSSNQSFNGQKNDINKKLAKPKQERAYRPTYEKVFFPFGLFISKFTTANNVSYFGVFLAIMATMAWYFSQNENFIFIYIALILMALSSLADMIDGSVARAEISKGKKIGKYGALLDPVMDRYAEAFFLIGITISGYVPPEWVLFSFSGMILASYVRARAESLGPDKDGNKLFISAGIERKEKLGILGIGAFVEAILFQLNLTSNWPYFQFGNFEIGPIAWSVVIVALLSHLAAFQRLKLAKKYLVEI